MKAHLPPPPPPDPQPPPQPTPPVPGSPATTFRSRRRLQALIAVLVLAGVGTGLWLWLRGEKPPEPPLPPGIIDPEVKAVVEKSRGVVLADPTSADAWGRYGLVLLGNLIDREADVCFAQAAKLNPSDPRWPYARALIALKRRPDEVEALLRQTIAAAQRDAEYRAVARLTLGETLLERREVDAAAELFRAELGTGGVGEARAVFGLGLVAVSRGDDAEAERMFAKVQRVAYCRKQVAVHLATLARSRGDADAAKRHEQLVRELNADPPWPDPILDHVLELQAGTRGRDRRIDRLEQAGKFREALREYEVQLASERTPKALTGAAVNLARLQEYDEALTLLREAVKLDPDHVQAHYTLALVLFTRAEKQWHANPGMASTKAELQEVIVEARKTTELKPDYYEAYLFWGLALKFLDRPKEAIEPLRKGLVARPDDFMLNLSLGQVLAATGDTAGARTHLETAKELRPEDPRPTQELDKLKGK